MFRRHTVITSLASIDSYHCIYGQYIMLTNHKSRHILAHWTFDLWNILRFGALLHVKAQGESTLWKCRNSVRQSAAHLIRGNRLSKLSRGAGRTESGCSWLAPPGTDCFLSGSRTRGITGMEEKKSGAPRSSLPFTLSSVAHTYRYTSTPPAQQLVGLLTWTGDVVRQWNMGQGSRVCQI